MKIITYLCSMEVNEIKQKTEIQRFNSLMGYFIEQPLPEGKITLSGKEVITDASDFVASHLSMIEENLHDSIKVIPYLDRLERFKYLLDKKNADSSRDEI